MAAARSSLFHVGDKVEVTADCVSLGGSLFPGEVVKVIPREKRLQVEFQLLKPNNEKGTIVREMVDECMVRPPVPPADHDCKFAAGDIVDAFYKGGWWEGTITQVLQQHQDQDSKFTLFFRFASIEVNLDASQLRHHQEWINGAWLPPLNNNNGEGQGQPETSAKGE